MLADKKKLLVIAGLAVAVLGIGVFEFAGGGGQAPAPEKKPAAHARSNAAAGTQKSGDAATPSASASGNPADGKPSEVPGATQEVAERDPFDGSKFMPAPTKQGTPAPSPAQTRPAPAPMPGKLGPLSVTPDVPGGRLPNPAAFAGQHDPNAFDYAVSGVITGERPAVIFADSQGNQRLIQLGGSLGPDTKVVAISRGKVTVRHHGKELNLTVGAGNPTEKRSDEK